MQKNDEKDTTSEESQPVSLNNQVWGPWITSALGIAVGVAMILVIVLGTLIFILINRPINFEDALNTGEGFFSSVISIIASLAGISLIFLFTKLRRGASIREYLGFQRTNLKTILLWLAVMIGLIVITDGFNYVLGRPLSPQSNVDIYKSSVWPEIIWVEVVLVAPLMEEILFRGFLFEGFRRSKMGIILTIVILSLVWTGLHFEYDFFDLGGVFIGGILLGIARHKTNSLWVPISMHAFGNLVATIEIALNMNAIIR
jgi:uncharacterized protein